MKQFVLWLVTLASGLLFPAAQLSPISETPVPTPNASTTIVSYKEHQYRYFWYQLGDNDFLELYSNLPETTDSATLKVKYQCKVLINGGFYSSDNEHIGWFVSNNQEISPSQTNQLFNGYFHLINTRTAQISKQPEPKAEIGLQSGPLLYYQSQPQTLSLTTDKPRRRSFALITDQGRVILGIILDLNSDYTGPNLANLPDILKIIANQQHWTINSAINLDGGTASAYYADQVSFKELSPIGSFFCIK